MKTRLLIIGSALMASLFCLPAMAQPAPGQGMGPEWDKVWVPAWV